MKKKRTKKQTSDSPRKSDNHLCFIGWRQVGDKAGFRCLDETETEWQDFELFMDPDTCVLLRARVKDPVKRGVKMFRHTVTCRDPYNAICTGEVRIDEELRALGTLPSNDTLDRYRKRYKETSTMTSKKTKSGGTGRQTIADAWEELFIKNGKAAKKNRMTDDQIREEMKAKFPERAGKTTITRVSMYRSCYNNGTFMYEGRGKSGTKERPLSVAYDENGDEVKRGSVKAQVAKKKVAKKKVAKKKVAKKKVAKKNTKVEPVTEPTAPVE